MLHDKWRAEANRQKIMARLFDSSVFIAVLEHMLETDVQLVYDTQVNIIVFWFYVLNDWSYWAVLWFEFKKLSFIFKLIWTNIIKFARSVLRVGAECESSERLNMSLLENIYTCLYGSLIKLLYTSYFSKGKCTQPHSKNWT